MYTFINNCDAHNGETLHMYGYAALVQTKMLQFIVYFPNKYSLGGVQINVQSYPALQTEVSKLL